MLVDLESIERQVAGADLQVGDAAASCQRAGFRQQGVSRRVVVVVEAAVGGEDRGGQVVAEDRMLDLVEAEGAHDPLTLRRDQEVVAQSVSVTDHPTPGREVGDGGGARTDIGVPPRRIFAFGDRSHPHAR